MVLLDTNVFIIDRFFPRDERYKDNKAFINRLPQIEAGFYIFSLFELCGIASFNLSTDELMRWIYHFDQVYAVQILEPVGLYTELAIDWFEHFSNEIFKLYRKKMTWGDAVLLQGAEEHGAETIITWNTKHFINRTMINVLTPSEYL